MSEHEYEDDGPAQRLDRAIWTRIWGYTRPYRREVVWLSLLAIGTAAADIALPIVTQRVIDGVAEQGAEFRFAPYVLAYAALSGVLCACVLGFIRVGGFLRTHVGHDIRRDGFDNLQRLSFSFFDQKPVGWLVARMTADCDRLSQILAWGVLDLVWGGAVLVGVCVVMLWTDAVLALVALSVLPVVAALSLWFQRRILDSARQVRGLNSQLTAAYNEGISGVRTVKALAGEEQGDARFGALVGRMHAASVRNQLLSALYLPLVMCLGSLSTGLVLVWGGVQVDALGLSLGTLILFVTYSRMFFEPVQEIAAWFAEMQMAQAAAERVLSLVEAVPEIEDGPAVRERVRAHAQQELAPGQARDGLSDAIEHIEFRDVGFAYGAGPPVFADLNLSLRAGESVALVGSTGGGKSTLVGLLARFYEPTQGAILLDGHDYRERELAWLRGKLGVVQQQPYLFGGSVADNLRFGRLDASDEELRACSQLIGLDEYVQRMPQGYDTPVGEFGDRLSAGERQLVSLARALLADPELLILDEATSAVDTHTEQVLQAGLETVLHGRTSVVVAHRLSTIQRADRILVVEAGRIVEQGDHASLLAQGGRYFELYTQQALRESGTGGLHWGEEPASPPESGAGSDVER